MDLSLRFIEWTSSIAAPAEKINKNNGIDNILKACLIVFFTW
jgi:hypothetical protein